MEQQAETLTAVHGCACLVLCSCTSFSRCTRRWQERLPRQAYPGVLRAAASHGLYSFSRFNQIIESVKKRQMFLSFGNRHYCCLEPFWIGMYLALFTGTKALVTQHEDSVFLVQQTLTFRPFLWSPQNHIQNFQKHPKAWSEVTANEWLLYLVQWDFSGIAIPVSFSPMEVVYIFQKGTSIWWVRPLGLADNNMKNDDETIMKSHD